MAFARFLECEDGALAPWEWWISEICKMFGCMPSDAVSEYYKIPNGTLQRIMELRAFQEAWALLEQQVDDPKMSLPNTPIMKLAKEIDFALADEALKKKTHG